MSFMMSVTSRLEDDGASLWEWEVGLLVKVGYDVLFGRVDHQQVGLPALQVSAHTNMYSHNHSC